MRARATPHAFPWPVLAALLASVAIVLGSAYLSRQNAAEVEAITREVTYTGEMLDLVGRLRAVLHAAESGQRGYLLTSERGYLEPYAKAMPQLRDLLAELKMLGSTDERQRLRIITVQELVEGKMAELRSTVEAAERGDRAEALRVVGSGRGAEIMDGLLKVLTELRHEQLQLRSVYRDRLVAQRGVADLSQFVTTAVVLSQIALCYFLLLRYLRQRRDAEARLADLNEGLEEEVRKRTVELRGLAGYLMTVREEEKARIARELHDEMGSSLTAVNMDLATARRNLGDDTPLGKRLARATDALKATVEGMRRIIEGLRPTMLESLGLREAVRAWAADHTARAGIPLALDIPETLPPLPVGTPIGLYRIMQEAVTNALRHARPKSIRLTMRVEQDNVVLEVVDDGVGIAPRPATGGRTPHGLLGIRERALAMGGAATVGPGPAGRGTEVRVVVPVARLRTAAPD